VRIPVQVGGGLRDGAAVESALAAGAARAVLGTLAVADPERAAAICGAHPGRVAIGLDARDGRLRVAGWTAGAETTATAAAAGASGLGAAAIIYTDIGRDGTERGPDVDGTRAVARAAAGDPVEAAARYDAEGADELTFLDITASHEERPIILDVVARTAERVFMPLTVGGGVRTVDDVRALLKAGADKVSINTAAVARPEL